MNSAIERVTQDGLGNRIDESVEEEWVVSESARPPEIEM